MVLCLIFAFLAMSAEAAPTLPPSAAARPPVRLEVTRRVFPAVDSPCDPASSGPPAYHWPVKPFRRSIRFAATSATRGLS